jgi:hypothetical protein
MGLVSIQQTEKQFREAVKAMPNVHISKIQVNPYAHKSTEGDFFVQTTTNDIIVECKQVSMKNIHHRKAFDISRLTQETKLVNWVKLFPRNKAYLFLNFYGWSKDTSWCFLISIEDWIKFRKENMKNKHHERKTLTAEFCDERFNKQRVYTKDNNWDIKFY